MSARNLFNSRRRKDRWMDGSVPGVEYNRRRGGYSRTPFDRQVSIDSPQPVQEYPLDPGKMDTVEPSYDGYDWQPQQRLTPQLRLDPVEKPEQPEAEPVPTYKDTVRLQQMILEIHGDPYASCGQEPDPSADQAEAQAAAGLGQIVNEAFQSDPMAEMASDLEELAQEMAPPPPLPEPEPEELDPYRQMMNAFGMMGIGPMM